MDKKSLRPQRPAAVRAATIFNNGAGQGGSGSDDEDEMYAGTRVPVRSGRRVTKVDLGKLHLETLHRYRLKFGLKEMGNTKDDLVTAVTRHFLSSNAPDEEETILRFAQAVHRNGKHLAVNGGIKKQRTMAAKPKGR